jgi:acid phosphatase
MLSLLKIPRFSSSTILLSVCLFGAACGGGSGASGGGGTSPTTPPSSQGTFSHVAVVVLENHSYSDVIGNTDMPYLNGLAQQYSLAAQYFANTHPSLPNYFMLTAGNQETTGDNSPGVVTDDNVVRELTQAGKSWRCYAEGLPSVGYLGTDVYPYVQHHNPFVFFSDVQNDSSQAANIVPFTQFASDLANSTLPQYSFIVPDILDDAHDGTLAQADQWLQTNIDPLISNSAFQSSGLLIITFDEGDVSDLANGGGQVATVIVSAQAKKNYVSQTLFQHQSLLRLTLSASGVTTFPGAAASAPDMSGFIAGP